MKATILDTETSAMVRWGDPSDHPDQPHIVQLAAVLIEWDKPAPENLPAFTELVTLIRPDGWEIDERLIGDDGKPTAFSVHGITNERALAEGRPFAEVMDELDAGFLAPADEMYAYGATFDRRVLRTASMRRWGRDNLPRAGQPPTPWFCIMNTARTLMERPKFVSLTDAHMWAFGEPFAGAHDAMNDLRATVRLWHHIREKHGGAFVRLKDKE